MEIHYRKAALFLACLLGLLCASRGQDSRARTAADPSTGIAPDALPWLPGGASENFIDVMALTSALQVTNAGDASTKVAAFKDGRLVGWREHNIGDRPPRMFTNAWDESYQASSPGELWWGRSGNTQIAVGQESWIRLSGGSPASKLFLRGDVTYHLLGATHATFTGGSGGRGNIDPGNIGSATVDLTTSPGLHGRLSFSVSVDGTMRSFVIPLMANTRHSGASSSRAEERYRLRAAAEVDGADCRCEERPAASTPYSSVLCEFPDSPHEHYELYGAFFGDHAALCAVFYQLEVNVPSRNRKGVKAEGIIVLQAGSGRE